MAKATVALVRCASYDDEAVYAALKRGSELLGGLDRFVRPGERILLKPNILAGDDPSSAVVTHPAVLAGCIRLFREGGGVVFFGDSPGLEGAAHAARRSGLEEAGVRCGATYSDFAPGGLLANPGGRYAQDFPVAQAVLDCEGIINLPKMKTHQLTRISGAVKNLFGCIPGKRKALYHLQYPDVNDFCGLLAELGMRLRPRLHILDGIVAMEGNGPRGGDPRAIGALLLAEDPVALDATFARLVALDPTFVPTIVAGHKAGLGCWLEDEVDCVGDGLDALACPDFRLIRRPVYSNATLTYYNAIKRLVVPRPAIAAERCIRCGQCIAACPVPEKALRFRKGRHKAPEYDYDRCIRCYCCQEMCPHRAIERVTPLLGRVLKVG